MDQVNPTIPRSDVLNVEASKTGEAKKRFDPLAALDAIVKSPAFVPGLLLFAGIGLAFWPLIKKLPDLWFSTDGYYSHGLLVPLMVGYLIYDKWDRIKNIPVRGFWPALIPLGVLLYANYVAARSPRDLFLSMMLVGTLLLAIWFVAGFRWLLALSLPVLYLLLGLPIWEQVIDVYTQPLQTISTDMSEGMLKALGFVVHRMDATSLLLPNFSMYVGVPCSGLRTIIATVALTAFCIMIGRMQWWANLLLAAIAIPLCIIVNGFRIALIGVVGETMGHNAGMAFHDTSGHISIVVLILIIWNLTKALGMK
jgi:exosortase